MGITAKIWSATKDDLEKSLHNPDHVDNMFHRLSDQQYALIHDARRLATCFERLAGLNSGLVRIAGASDPSYAISPERVIALLNRLPNDPYKELFAYKTICVNRIEIIDIVTHAAMGDLGIIACVFEDY